MVRSVILRLPDDLFTWFEDHAGRDWVAGSVEQAMLAVLIDYHKLCHAELKLRLTAQLLEVSPLVIVNPETPASVPVPRKALDPRRGHSKKARRRAPRYRRGGARV